MKKESKQTGKRYSPEECVKMKMGMAEAVRMECEVLVVVVVGGLQSPRLR